MLRNNYFFGILLGAVVPLLGVTLVYVIRYMPRDVSLPYFLELMQDNPRTISATLSLGLLACIPLFTYYKNRRLMKTLYGIFIPVVIYAIIVLVYRFGLV